MPEPRLPGTDLRVAEELVIVAGGADPAALCEQVLKGLRRWDTAGPRHALRPFHEWFAPLIPSSTPSTDDDAAVSKAEAGGAAC